MRRFLAGCATGALLATAVFLLIGRNDVAPPTVSSPPASVPVDAPAPVPTTSREPRRVPHAIPDEPSPPTATSPPDTPRVDVASEAPRAADTVLLRVYGPDGSPLDDVDVGLRTDGPRGFAFDGAAATRESAGVFRVGLGRDVVGSDARTTLEVTWREHWTKHVAVTPRTDREVTARFDDAAEAEVTVDGLPKELRGRVGVVLRPAGRAEPVSGPLVPGTTTDTWEFGPLDPGSYELVLVQAESRGATRSSALVRRTVELRRGANPLRLEFPRLFDLRVAAADGRTGALNVLPARVGTSWSEVRDAQLDDTGRGVFRGVPAGRYFLELLRDDGPPASEVVVDVPTDGEFILRTAHLDALLVRVIDAKGALGAAGLVDGDLVVAIDGHEFATYVDGDRLVRAARGADKFTMSVRRGARRLDVSATSAVFADESRAGGWLEFASAPR